METARLQISATECCGCEACALVCKQNAITMQANNEGFLYPSIKQEICVNCGNCSAVCPVKNRTALPMQTHNIRIFAAYTKDTCRLIQSSSGGIATEIMRECISNEYWVAGVRYSEDFCSAFFDITRNIDDLLFFTGTKYIQSRKEMIYLKIQMKLEAGDSVLFIGLPCEVAALKLYLKRSYCSLVTVELICHGVTSPTVSKKYIENLQQKHRSKVVAFSIRYKKYGWSPSCIRAVFSNGKDFTRLFDSTEYGYAFRKMSRLSCYSCKYKGDLRVADITVGDYWGVKPADPCWNADGVSVVFVHTNKGEEMMSRLSGINSYIITYDQAISANSLINNSRQDNGRSMYAKVFAQKGLYSARRETETLHEVLIRNLRNLYYSFRPKRN